MASNLAHLPEPEPLRAVTVSRDVQEFDLLIEDMEAELGEGWGDLTFSEALTFLRQDDARTLEFIVLAIDRNDEERLPRAVEVIRHAKRAGLKVVLVADGLGSMSLHELLRAGVDDFAPYPLPENALSEAVARIRQPGTGGGSDLMKRAGGDMVDATAVAGGANVPGPVSQTAAAPTTPGGGTSNGEGALFAIQSASGGNGATTIAVNLAWELAHVQKAGSPSVCILDLGLQFGSVATYLDLPRSSSVYEVLTDIGSMDQQAFRQTLTPYKDTISIWAAPSEVLPLDVVGPEEIEGLLKLARAAFDIVIVDMPGTVTGWTDIVMQTADIYYIACELEVRSAQNALRFQRLLQSEGIATDRLGYVLNKAPGKMDLSGKSRIDKFAESLDVKFNAVLPDGGKQVTEVNDQAGPLRDLAPRNALTKEIARMAAELHKARQEVEENGAAAPRKKKAIFGIQFG